MIDSLGTEEICALIEPTFAIVVESWDSLTLESQGRAYEMVSSLLKDHATMIRSTITSIPSLASIPVMSELDEELRRSKARVATRHQLQALMQRFQNENNIVVVRALVELEGFLEENQDFVYDAATSEQPDPVIPQLARSLLDVCIHFNESDNNVVILCAKCFGLLGCLDSTRIEGLREKKEIIVLSNFQEAEETIDFVIFFLREVLVKSFLSASSPRAQGFLAYAMQELLKFCGLNGSVTFRNRERHPSASHLRWVTLPESVRTTLTPFLNSKYVVTAAAVQNDIPYPIYRSNMTHGQWLRNFVYDLLRKGEGGNIAELFPVFSRIIRTQDISISNFLLPFSFLNTIVSGSKNQRMEAAGELNSVLSHPLPEGDVRARDNLILCSQVCLYHQVTIEFL